MATLLLFCHQNLAGEEERPCREAKGKRGSAAERILLVNSVQSVELGVRQEERAKLKERTAAYEKERDITQASRVDFGVLDFQSPSRSTQKVLQSW